MSRKFALVIGSSDYSDRRLSRLASPEADVAGLADSLASPELGQFDEVKTLINERRQPGVSPDTILRAAGRRKLRK